MGSLHWHKADERRNGSHTSDSCEDKDREIRFAQGLSELAYILFNASYGGENECSWDKLREKSDSSCEVAKLKLMIISDQHSQDPNMQIHLQQHFLEENLRCSYMRNNV